MNPDDPFQSKLRFSPLAVAMLAGLAYSPSGPYVGWHGGNATTPSEKRAADKKKRKKQLAAASRKRNRR